MITIIGLGNPGEDYEDTRHNTGRMAATFVADKLGIELEEDKKYLGVGGKGSVGKEDLLIVLPNTFMNKSGLSAAKVVKSKKAAEKLIVIYDDLDLPIGTMKVSFNRGSGGHRGIESIKKALGTEAFARIRIGISPVTPSGKLKKPLGEKKVEKHIMGSFSVKEKETLKKLFKRALEVVELFSEKGIQSAMTEGNRS